jgi:hypothetical protein
VPSVTFDGVVAEVLAEIRDELRALNEKLEALTASAHVGFYDIDMAAIYLSSSREGRPEPALGPGRPTLGGEPPGLGCRWWFTPCAVLRSAGSADVGEQAAGGEGARYWFGDPFVVSVIATFV